MLKDYLSGRGIRYSEKMVDLDETAKAEMASLSGGFLGVPFTLISKDDGTKDTVIGFDERKLSQLI